MQELKETGERFMPGMGGVIELEHIHRYRLASMLADGRDVLDIASGEGYGSFMIAEMAKSVIGVDKAHNAITHSQATYRRDNLSFRQGWATAIPLPDASIDLAVSFETIEHLSDQDAMLAELRRVLRPGGLLLISSPNKAVYSDLTDYENPFHERELYSHEFRSLVGAYFSNVAHYLQKTTGASVIVPETGQNEFFSFAPDGIQQASLAWHRYDLLLASDGLLPDLPASLYERPDTDLQPERAELHLAKLSEARDLARDAWEKVAEVTDQAEMLRQECDRLRGAMANGDVQSKSHQTQEPIANAGQLDQALSVGMLRQLSSPSLATVLYWFSRQGWLFSSRRRNKFFRSATKRDPKKRSSRSGPVLAAPAVPSLQRRVAPHLTVVAMARNESSRANDTMRHFCAMFDRVVVIDHLSDDDTADIVRGYDGVAGTQVIVLRGEDSGYYQSEYMSAVANALLVEGRTDWLFFLDFDEFLPFADASVFRQALVDVTTEPVIHGHWYNLALQRPIDGSLQGAAAVLGPRVSDFVKIALNARLVVPGVTVTQGNHALRLPGRDADEIGARAFGILHVPIAGFDALRSKVAQGISSLQDTVGKVEGLGAHWRDIHTNIDKLASDANLARDVALKYGEPVDGIIDSIAAGQKIEGTRNFRLNFAQAAPAVPAAAKDIPTFNLQTAAQVLREQFAPPAAPTTLDGLGVSIYSRLTARATSKVHSYRSQIDDALMAASTEIEVVVPTAWSGHIPFLFSLMEIQRPRRYVELGTHAGASFFAACQHMRSNGNYGEAVAIDLWTGDHQAGLYEETVFQNFKHLLNRHFPTTGRLIRSYFSQAVSCFEDRSIDLLHIDGLHTYEAVEEDYKTWRPKLTDNGVIIFHDTNEYQTDFGVWQFFEEIRHEAQASFQFRHGHGLGVMAFGTPATNPSLELLTYFSSRPEKIESFYATLGKVLFQAARSRHA